MRQYLGTPRPRHIPLAPWSEAECRTQRGIRPSARPDGGTCERSCPDGGHAEGLHSGGMHGPSPVIPAKAEERDSLGVRILRSRHQHAVPYRDQIPHSPSGKEDSTECGCRLASEGRHFPESRREASRTSLRDKLLNLIQIIHTRCVCLYHHGVRSGGTRCAAWR